MYFIAVAAARPSSLNVSSLRLPSAGGGAPIGSAEDMTRGVRIRCERVFAMWRRSYDNGVRLELRVDVVAVSSRAKCTQRTNFILYSAYMA